jgi:hypothetical protein
MNTHNPTPPRCPIPLPPRQSSSATDMQFHTKGPDLDGVTEEESLAPRRARYLSRHGVPHARRCQQEHHQPPPQQHTPLSPQPWRVMRDVSGNRWAPRPLPRHRHIAGGAKGDHSALIGHARGLTKGSGQENTGVARPNQGKGPKPQGPASRRNGSPKPKSVSHHPSPKLSIGIWEGAPTPIGEIVDVTTTGGPYSRALRPSAKTHGPIGTGYTSE